jgi:hypothetical protein
MSLENERALASIADRDSAWANIWNNSPVEERIRTLGCFAAFVWESLSDFELTPDTFVYAPPRLEHLLPSNPEPAWALSHEAPSQIIATDQTVRTKFPKTVCLLSEGRIAHCAGTPPKVRLKTRLADHGTVGCVSYLLRGEMALPVVGAGLMEPEPMLEETVALLAEFARDYDLV